MRVLLLLLLLSFWKPADAQRSYFLYLESEGGQPFYVRMEDRIISSNAPGYLVLPEMADSTYEIFIGFSNGRRATKFSIPMTARDRGLVLRQEEGRIRLLDLQTDAPLAPIPDPFADVQYTVRTDPFTVLLSRAAHDTDILYVPVAQPAVVKKQEPAPQLPIEAQVQVPATDTVKTNVEVPTAQLTTPVRDSVLGTRADSSAVVNAPAELKPDTLATNIPVSVADSHALRTSDSTSLAVRPPQGSDSVARVSDSVVVVPPASTLDSSQQQPAVQDTVARIDIAKPDSVGLSTQVLVDSAKTLAPEPEYRKTEIRKYGESSTSEGFGLVFIDQTPEGPDTIRLIIPNPPFNLGAADTVKKDDPVLFLEVRKDSVRAEPELASLSLSRPRVECPAQATDNDFFRLRKSMAGRTTDEDMIEDARKYFRKMCFSTEQIRNLSVLFLTAAGKYGFFDAAYLHVSDQQQFATLESEIRDPYYAKRFKALIGD